ncbi:hypothetical protein P168DRAFT_299535 [Aspergillus campestris IBT 28561]|uniref:SWIM-type domain-containing protein n=1 Tax=Aspergillus campestris (strain IBT 28561) TaxID=1392248 RepID=A0A2I1CUE5_ASPC2|nr:uncharacterized protein P168DRAFT_299535 [Aspergillus campestris IBT 28561]PKY01252.1 hypothetical protein P168DRAFT_299535 [Aspergillus campestris IBT 28561]
MSLPTRRLHRLSISSDMPDRRFPGEGPARPDSGQIESSSEESESEEEASPERSTIQGSSGINYSLDRLDNDAEARALVGLASEFDITTCSRWPTGYHFQLSEHRQVHVGPDGYTCTCLTFVSRPNVACQHIFWLLDRLHSNFTPQDTPNTIPLSTDGHPPGHPRIERLLHGKLEQIADQHNWPYIRSESEGGMTRPQKVKDIITAFSATILPEDFRPDLTDDPAHRRTPEQCVVQGDFEATMFRLATHDDAVYSPIYFDKIQGQSRKLLADFDRYALTGHLPADDNNNTNPIDVRTVLHKIQLNVYRIQSNIIARAPHGTESASKALITLLEDICSRNKDALDGNRWGRTTFHGEDEDSRNLYHQLIGTAEETGRCFVLDALEHLPASALHQFRDRLMAVQRKAEVNRAPKAYILKLGGLVRRAEAVGAVLGQKRLSTAAPRGQSKRTR